MPISWFGYSTKKLVMKWDVDTVEDRELGEGV